MGHDKRGSERMYASDRDDNCHLAVGIGDLPPRHFSCLAPLNQKSLLIRGNLERSTRDSDFLSLSDWFSLEGYGRVDHHPNTE